MDPTQQMPQGQMSPQQQALLMALMQQQPMQGNPMAQSGGMPPAGITGAQNQMGGGFPTQQMPAGPVSPYASMLGVQPPQGY